MTKNPPVGNGPHLLGIMSHLVLCCIRGYVVRHYVAFGVMSFGIMLPSGLCCSALCHSGLCRVCGYVVRHMAAFSIMLHSDLCIWDCVVQLNVVRLIVVWPTVSVSYECVKIQPKVDSYQ